MKNQEFLIPNVPVVIKIKIQNKKLFSYLQNSLYTQIAKEVLTKLCQQTQNCFFGYIIADHIYLLLLDNYNKKDGQMWYGGEISKILSDSISRTTLLFNNILCEVVNNEPDKPVKENYEDPKTYIADLVKWKEQIDIMNDMKYDTRFCGTVFNIAKEQLSIYLTGEQNKLNNNFNYHFSVYARIESLLMELPGNKTAFRKSWRVSNVASKKEISSIINRIFLL